MKTLKFKTNAKCAACVAEIGKKLNRICSPADWSIDLMSPDKVLSVNTDLPPGDIIGSVEQAGFKAEPVK